MLDTVSLDGKVVVVTGSGTGLGKEMVLALARAGADVVLASRRIAPIEETAGQIQDLGRKALAIPTDVIDSTQVNHLFSEALNVFGKVDVLVNNAGVVSDQGGISIWEITDSDWSNVLGANLTGSFYCSRAIAKHMVERGQGKIINMSSGFGLRGGRDNYAYGCAKGGVIQLTRILATSLGRYGVTSNCIVPGLFSTEGVAGSRGTLPTSEYIPVGRVGDPRELGPTAVFLASDASDYMNGAIFAVDGGSLAGGYAPTGHAPMMPLEL